MDMFSFGEFRIVILIKQYFKILESFYKEFMDLICTILFLRPSDWEKCGWRLDFQPKVNL